MKFNLEKIMIPLVLIHFPKITPHLGIKPPLLLCIMNYTMSPRGIIIFSKLNFIKYRSLHYTKNINFLYSFSTFICQNK